MVDQRRFSDSTPGNIVTLLFALIPIDFDRSDLGSSGAAIPARSADLDTDLKADIRRSA